LYHQVTQNMNDIFIPQYSYWSYYWWFHEYCTNIQLTRIVWRYQMGNQIPYIEEEQTTQWPKEKSTKGQTTIYKTYIYNKRSSNTSPTENRWWTRVGIEIVPPFSNTVHHTALSQLFRNASGWYNRNVYGQRRR
jgi:hypothetical protein